MRVKHIRASALQELWVVPRNFSVPVQNILDRDFFYTDSGFREKNGGRSFYE